MNDELKCIGQHPQKHILKKWKHSKWTSAIPKRVNKGLKRKQIAVTKPGLAAHWKKRQCPTRIDFSNEFNQPFFTGKIDK